MTEVYYIKPSLLWHFWHGEIIILSHVNHVAPLFFFFLIFFKIDFFKLHSQMSPHRRARAGSIIMPLIKHLSQNWRTKDGQYVNWNIKNVAFSVKTACTSFIVGDGLSCLAAHGTAGKLYCPFFRCRCQQCVRSGSAGDWQTVPLQPAANQPVSNTCCY